jgi:rhamnosyltransferase
MLEKLTSELDRLEAAGIAVAAVGPRFWDPRADNPPPFIQIRHGRVVRIAEQRESPVVEVDYLITSGSLIPITTFDCVGLLEERLFVDYVDIEWGLRAKREGFRCFGVFPAKMQHSLGDTPLRLAGARLPVHSALRHYYHFRNAVWLTRQAWVPLQWKFVNGYRLIGKFFVYSLLATPRWEHLRMMAKGIWHGLSDQLGQYA